MAEARKNLAADGGRIEHYKIWIKHLKEAGISFTLIASTKGTFRIISEDELTAVVETPSTGTNTKYSFEEVRSALQSYDFGYHRVELPYGLHTRGQEVWERFNLVFPSDMNEWSVLDIGCAYGAFSFEAERRGAQVTACDTNPERLEGARRCADLLGSSVIFSSRNYLAESSGATDESGNGAALDERDSTDVTDDSDNDVATDESDDSSAIDESQVGEGGTHNKFDLVLALNVLHHVPDVDKALAALVRLSARRVVLEFPNSQDPLYQAKKFRQDVGPQLLERVSLFSEIKIDPSPKAGRMMAICTVKNAIVKRARGGKTSNESDAAYSRGNPRRLQSNRRSYASRALLFLRSVATGVRRKMFR